MNDVLPLEASGFSPSRPRAQTQYRNPVVVPLKYPQQPADFILLQVTHLRVFFLHAPVSAKRIIITEQPGLLETGEHAAQGVKLTIYRTCLYSRAQTHHAISGQDFRRYLKGAQVPGHRNKAVNFAKVAFSMPTQCAAHRPPLITQHGQRPVIGRAG